jgi:hypothetical protein
MKIKNKNTSYRIVTRFWFVLSALMLSSCASYKSTWDCPKVRGIGCSSVEYADYVAREKILFNKMVHKIKENKFDIEEENDE